MDRQRQKLGQLGLLVVLAWLAGCASNSIYIPDVDDVIAGKEETLKNVTIGVWRNPHRAVWNSPINGRALDWRQDENVLLAEYLAAQELFADVQLVDSLQQVPRVDYVISCSVDCIYTVELDGLRYFLNIFPLCGLGFVLGLPYEDSSALYVAQTVVYDMSATPPRAICGSLAENLRTWYWDNIYWRPDFYGASAMKPLFAQILYDFVTRSGCLK